MNSLPIFFVINFSNSTISSMICSKRGSFGLYRPNIRISESEYRFVRIFLC